MAKKKPTGLTREEKATLGRILKKARAFKAFYNKKGGKKSTTKKRRSRSRS